MSYGRTYNCVPTVPFRSMSITIRSKDCLIRYTIRHTTVRNCNFQDDDLTGIINETSVPYTLGTECKQCVHAWKLSISWNGKVCMPYPITWLYYTHSVMITCCIMSWSCLPCSMPWSAPIFLLLLQTGERPSTLPWKNLDPVHYLIVWVRGTVNPVFLPQNTGISKSTATTRCDFSS